jgi:ABC-type antimicrobial peptide transport system permease subunit
VRAQFNEVGLLETRLSAEVFTSVAALGLVLGILGLYGVIAYSVAQRTHEIGIRMVVGASAEQVSRMVLLQGLRSSGIAAAIGIGVALALSGVMQHFRFIRSRRVHHRASPAVVRQRRRLLPSQREGPRWLIQT